VCDFMSIRALPETRYNKCAYVGVYVFDTCYIGLSNLYRWPGRINGIYLHSVESKYLIEMNGIIIGYILEAKSPNPHSCGDFIVKLLWKP